MVPVTEPPPELHVGWECCKCKASSFAGRRYACWLCVNYQLCGSCYDSGNLPVMPGHKFYHHLDVHYTRAEYELYFGGEPYRADDVLQSYKCAMCSMSGLDIATLETHVNAVHVKHLDYMVYSRLIFSRRKAAVAAAVGDNLPVSQSIQMRLMRHAIERMRTANAIENDHTASMGHQELGYCIPLYNGSGLSRERLNMEPPSCSASSTTTAIVTAKMEQHRLRQQLRQQDLQQLRQQQIWQLQQQQHRDLAPWNDDAGISICFADVVRGVNNNNNSNTDNSKQRTVEKKDTGKKDKLIVETNQFLCAPFLSLAAEAPLGEQQLPNRRGPFVEALLCSMLADEELSAVTPQPPAGPQFTIKVNQAQKCFSELTAGNENSTMTVPEMISKEEEEEEATQQDDNEPSIISSNTDPDTDETNEADATNNAGDELNLEAGNELQDENDEDEENFVDYDHDWGAAATDSCSDFDDYFDY